MVSLWFFYRLTTLVIAGFPSGVAQFFIFLKFGSPAFYFTFASVQYLGILLKIHVTMASIKNLNGLTVQDLNYELSNGGKFVMYQYCISILIMTFRRSSDVYFIRGDESSFKHGISYTVLTFLLGWWGIPWGPIYSIGALYTNFSGGKNVTQQVLDSMATSQQ